MLTNKPLSKIEKILRYTLPVIVLIVAAIAVKMINSNGPKPDKYQSPAAMTLSVETIPIEQGDYTINLQSNGVIQPRSQAEIASQVSGTVVTVADSFIAGGFFAAGDILLAIDDRDYQLAVRIAESDLVNTELSLAEEQAKSQQAQRDWSRLNRPGKPNDLVLRKPQLASAQAAMASAQAKLEQAQLALERTKIIAPYAGRVLTKNVDLGQFVNVGTALATIYAIDYVEIRLPLNSQQQSFIQLPEQFKQTTIENYPATTVTAKFGLQKYQWQGKITRAEGALDTKSRQLYVVAQIEDPYSSANSDKPALKIGQFVDAEISGITLANAFIVDTRYVYEGDQVITYNKGILTRKNVNVIWRNAEHTIVDSGLAIDDQIVTTPLNSVVSGTKAKVIETAAGNKDNN